MRKLRDLNIKGKRCLIRVDFNVPMDDGVVLNDFRIRAALPTIKYCLDNGASVILMSHLGRPKGSVIPEFSLDSIQFVLEDHLDKDVLFSDDCISDEAITTSMNLEPGEIHLLENLRFHAGETDNDVEFSRKLAKHGDVYINDAFGTAHRAHASNVGVVEFFKEAAGGFLLEKERKYLGESIENPEKPLTVVLGGSKVSGKIELIKNMARVADAFIVGGAMAFTFLKAQGKNIGNSRVEEDNLGIAAELLDLLEKENIKIFLPADVVAAPELDTNSPWRVTTLENLYDDEMGFDIGPETCMLFENAIEDANTIIWNGPMGVFELPVFATGTHSIAHAIIEKTLDGALSIVGGGDTAAAIDTLGLDDQSFSHISTGGGASLELLSGIYLPAFKVLDKNDQA